MPHTLPTEAQILIVGAGPSGLAAAISLICNGIEPSNLSIVDCAEKGANTSRALAIHSATLEALDQYDCASRLIELGIKGTDWRVGDRSSSTIFETSFGSNAPYTKYPFMLILEQSTTEHVLEERLRELGVEVKRPFRVVGMRDSGDKATSVLFESGEIVRTKFVIGADGVRSSVRQLSGIDFTDPDGKSIDESVTDLVAQMVLADVSISLPEDQAASYSSGLSLTTSDAGMFLLLPLGKPTVGEGLYKSSQPVYRVGFNVPRAQGEPPSKPSLEYIQRNIDQQAPFSLCSDPKVNPNPVKITQVHWSTRLRIRSAIADVFFKRVHGGIVLLIGDAGHVHSPAGGQGMNIGLRDATGLGPVLVGHIRKSEKSDKERSDENNSTDPDADTDTATLKDYAALRRMRGLENIRLTKRMTGTIGFVLKPRLFNWPLWIFKLLLKLSVFQNMFVYRLSGLGNR